LEQNRGAILRYLGQNTFAVGCDFLLGVPAW